MDKNDIINYVMHTPHNTNKAVLSDMLNQLTEGGGGGSSDFSTATVTIDGDNDSTYAYFTCATYTADGTFADAEMMSGDSFGVVLYKGVAMCEISCDAPCTTSGNIELIDGTFYITGDCTITIN